MLLLLCVMLVAAPSKIFVASFQSTRTASPFSPTLIGTETSPGRNLLPQQHHQFPNNQLLDSRCGRPSREGTSTSLNSFMGSDGGLFGIGTPELATILLVGYFVLGPSDLYKLVKEIGKFVNNIRTLGTQATEQFETTMESNMEMQEIRKAQRELNDAFSFRRSINLDNQVDPDIAEPGPQQPGPQEPVGAAAAAAATAGAAATSDSEGEAPKPRKKKRRRVKKKPPVPVEPSVSLEGTPTNNIPDLDMSSAFPDPPTAAAESTNDDEKDDWFKDGMPSASDMAKEDIDWLSDVDSDDSTTKPPDLTPDLAKADPQEQTRFQQQMSESWNKKVMDNEDELAPLAMIMERLAILEEEKAAADRRLEDEFRERFQLEQDFYQNKRTVLEETAATVQEEAYITIDGGKSKSK